MKTTTKTISSIVILLMLAGVAYSGGSGYGGNGGRSTHINIISVNGYVVHDEYVPFGSHISLKAIPNAGYEFAQYCINSCDDNRHFIPNPDGCIEDDCTVFNPHIYEGNSISGSDVYEEDTYYDNLNLIAEFKQVI